jgi:hypothetical protein
MLVSTPPPLVAENFQTGAPKCLNPALERSMSFNLPYKKNSESIDYKRTSYIGFPQGAILSPTHFQVLCLKIDHCLQNKMNN